MDDKEMEGDVISIDVIDPVGADDLVTIEEGSRRGTGSPIPVSDTNVTLKTGNIVAQVFKLIAEIRDREYWNLEDKEIKSLNKTCPKILPKIISEHSGIISCVLSVLGIIVKRLKMESAENESERPIETLSEDIPTVESDTGGLTGSRSE